MAARSRHDWRVTPQQLEFLVLEAVERARKFVPVEDDRIELKREWPDETKARQLAASANKAHGQPLIYVIGVDEKTGSLHNPSGIDPANWWSMMQSKFESLSPELEHNLAVSLGDGNAVVAMLFRTDRAPYVIKVGGSGSPEFEVPIRDNTRTRSARRDELLRMLVPAAASPDASVLKASVTATIYPADRTHPENLMLSGECELYLEHVGPRPVLLPRHRMRGALHVGEEQFVFKPDFWKALHDAAPAPDYGIHVRHDGVVATGPGVFSFNLNIAPPMDFVEKLRRAETLRLSVSFAIVGHDQPLDLIVTVRRFQYEELVGLHQRVGDWKFRTPHY